ncbi:MAG TPA: type II toxin-antitoxin system RelE/ParE family toxin, partial [Catalimonadaceae bacterium]|nr:type II toxin-antitoxin system RelE/ParE family toxin [Catalimonadaceae bacterium]
MSFEIRFLPSFEKELKRLAKKYPSIKQDFGQLVHLLKNNPSSGISLGNHCFKIRMSIASKGKGKSAGARVVYYLQVVDHTVFLMAIFDKS